MECPVCLGKGGGRDYFGEAWECDVCNETGLLTPEEHRAHLAKIAEMDRWIDQQMKQPAPVDTRAADNAPTSGAERR